MNNLLEQLNAEQRKPVEDTEGAVLVLAGAGSGKTRVLTTRIAYLIEEKGVSPDRILAITFTNKAAREMQERIDRMCDTHGMWVSTIHSMCVRILRNNAEQIGFNTRFSIYTEAERSTLIKKAFRELDYDDDKLLKSVKYHIGNAKTLSLDPEAYAVYMAQKGEGENSEPVEKVYTRYQKNLRENNAMDFDDLLVNCQRLLRDHEEVREYYAGKFRYILVDEFQDTNSVQFDIIRMLTGADGNLFAVGDDDQSIYGWRGADISNILHFERNFPAAKVYKLEQNYRSTKTILNLANSIIHNNQKRKQKTLWTENADGAPAVAFEAEEETEEALFTARTIVEKVKAGAKYSDFAVLMRINALTRSYEQEFSKYSIPYKVFGGFKFFERKEIKDLLAYLRIASNPFDSEAIVRIINFPRRGIGEKTVQALEAYASNDELTVYDALLNLDSLNVNSGAKAKLQAFASLLKELVIKGQELPVNELVRFLIERTNMREAYADNSDESVTKRANIDEFENSVEDFARLNPDATLDEYLNQVALSSDLDEMDESNYVTLATIHAVKGLEFPYVFVSGLEDGTMPTSRAQDSPEDMEEERRLMYVAITRAEQKIYFTRSKSRYLYGKREATVRSCFLKELATQLNLSEERPAYKRNQGDYDDPFESGRGYGYGGRSGGYGYNSGYGGNGYGNSAPRRTAYSGEPSYNDGDFRSFGARKTNRNPGMGATKSENTFNMAKKFTQGATTATKGNAAAALGDKAAVCVPGAKVLHPKFGKGEVLSSRGNPMSPIILVEFEGVGKKELSAQLAPLTVIK